MQSPVVTVAAADSPLAALQAMVTHGFHSVPVVADERLVGMVTSSDFLRELCHSDDPLLREPLVKHILGEKAQIDAGATLQAAINKMDVQQVDYLAVLSSGLPVGYVSRRDRVITAENDARQLTCGHVAETFHKPVPGVPLTAQLGDVMRTMLDKRAQVALVVDRQNRCRGLLSVLMILAAMAEAIEHAEAAHLA
jgi:CBS domain-containing protein